MSGPKWKAQLHRGAVELMVLASVRGRQVYGYQLVRELNDLDGVELTESTVYPLLARMKRAGHLDATRRPSPQGPSRLYYTITDAGEDHLAEMTAYWERLNTHVQALGADPERQ